MVTRKKKSRRMRGSRTCGWGVSGQHRKSGMRGGRGKAGLFKHKWTSVLRYGEIGKVGFTSPKSLRESRILNIGDLNLITQPATEQSEKAPVKLDLAALGYHKLLGRGSVQRPYNITVPKFSKSAAKKIQDAGGSITSRD